MENERVGEGDWRVFSNLIWKWDTQFSIEIFDSQFSESYIFFNFFILFVTYTII